ncbi:MAG: hypothetical protein GXP31_09015 [Kiritimatiellaeota bacterium]|nr:hypothetical protein [Kiritimatiellota bacterium]
MERGAVTISQPPPISRSPAARERRRPALPCLLPVAMLLCACAAVQAEIATYRIQRAETPPTVDGSLSDPCWTKACRVTSFHPLGTAAGTTAAVPATEAWLTYDAQALFIAFRCREPLAAGLEAPERPHDGPTWRDNGVEIFLDPAGNRTQYVQIAVNLAGSIMDGFIPSPAGKLNLGWETGASAAVRVGDNEWTLEIRVPFSGLPLTRPRGPWTFHLARNRAAAGQHLTSLRTPVSGYHEIANFARLEGIDLPEFAVCVLNATPGESFAGINRCRVLLRNWGKAPAAVRLAAGIEGEARPKRTRKALLLAANSTTTAVLPWTLEAGDGGKRFAIEVRLAENNRLIRRQTWPLPEPPPILGKIERPVFYYRQSRCVLLTIPINLAEGSRGRARLSWQARNARGDIVGNGFTTAPNRDAVLRLYWPHWFPGRYTLHMTLARNGGVLAESEQPLRLVENPWNERR